MKWLVIVQHQTIANIPDEKMSRSVQGSSLSIADKPDNLRL